MKFAIDEGSLLIYNSTEPGVPEQNFQNLPHICRFSDQILPEAAREGQGRSTVR